MPQVRFNATALVAARTAAGLTQAELAAAIGAKNRERVTEWEAGRDQPTPRFVAALAQTLRVPALQLLDTDPKEPSLADLRTAAGLTLTDVADATGIAYATYRRLEKGLRPINQDDARALANLLRTTIKGIKAAAERGQQ